MEILGNMQLLSSCSRVLTSYAYQNGYCECRESQQYHYGRCAMLKLVFVSTQIQTASSSKIWKKRAKNEKSRFAKNTFLFQRVHELDIVLRVNTDRKNRLGKVCSPKLFFDLSPVIRCAILEISSYLKSSSDDDSFTSRIEICRNIPVAVQHRTPNFFGLLFTPSSVNIKRVQKNQNLIGTFISSLLLIISSKKF